MALRDKLNAQLSGLFDFSFADTSNDAQQQNQDQQQQQQPENVDDAAEDLGFSFRLFRNEAPSHKVVLEQDDGLEQAGEGGFVVARRPDSYYIAEEPSSDVMTKFRATAVTADYLFQDAKKRRWGLEKPWRVTSITVTTKSAGEDLASSHAEAAATAESANRKKRPGKRRRIILRTRQKARKEREEAEKSKLVEKEQHLQDKKKRLNREKKLKRRAKEREKKLGSKGEGAASEHNSSRATSPE